MLRTVGLAHPTARGYARLAAWLGQGRGKMAIYGSAYQLQFSREPSGAAIHPDQARLVRSNSVWVVTDNGLTTLLERGDIPFPATGEAPVIRHVQGVTRSSVAADAYIELNAMSTVGQYNGVTTDNSTRGILRAGWDAYLGAGRAGGGEYLSVFDDMSTAVKGGGNALTTTLDCLAGAGSFDPVIPFPSLPWETGDLNGGLWSSHLGIFAFTDDATQATESDRIFVSMKNRGNSHTLPNGEVIREAAFSSITPDGTIYLAAGDLGGSGINAVPLDVAQNSASNLNNHPGVFISQTGVAQLREVARKWRDEVAINTTHAGQPVGILTYSDVTPVSKWLLVIDGVASVVRILHPVGTDYRRPKDIWNNVIAPMIATRGSDVTRIKITDGLGNDIGTSTRWQYISYARFIGYRGLSEQSNTGPIA